MLDEAAKAMARRWYQDEQNEPELSRTVENEWPDFVEAARAALQAIREADAETRMIGRNAVLRSSASLYEDYSVAIGHGFTAMIDAILAEGDKTT